MTHHTLTTTLTLPNDATQEVTVTYTHHRGYPPTLTDPGEPESVEIQSVEPDVPIECWDVLAVECWEDYAGYVADAAEYRARIREDYDD